MARGEGIRPSNVKAYPGKLTEEVFESCILAAMGGLIFGYDIGIQYSHYKLPRLPVYVDENPPCLLGGSLYLAGSAVSGFAKQVVMLIVGRLLLCFGIGFAIQMYRGALNMLFQLSITIGIITANLLNFVVSKCQYGWRISFSCAAVPPLIFFFGSLFLPDTPNSLIERGKCKEAKIILQKIRGVRDVDEEFNDLVLQVKNPRK
ncbi:hypothetical protein ACH5RR_038507 [Cinchona calisaya]|uniref:Major facilitator superfamily (MFS) profile domain-containing protein n=1 Tax=Cinchona calisaya TaxID=153742 RepID=A0ABD2Y157_9GENT